MGDTPRQQLKSRCTARTMRHVHADAMGCYVARIAGADRLAELWARLRTEDDQAKRSNLVADALCATSRLEAAVHEARYTAARLALQGEHAPDDTRQRAIGWANAYQFDF